MDNGTAATTAATSKSTQFGKLFVGQVPAVCTEDMLLPLFQPYGTIIEVKVMRDGSGRSKGCAWVRYETQHMAQAAIDALHEKHTIPPQTNTLQVRYAHSASGSGSGGPSSSASGNTSGNGTPSGGGPHRRGRPRGDPHRDAPAYEAAPAAAYFPPTTTIPGQPQQNNPYSMAWTATNGAGSFGSFGSASGVGGVPSTSGPNTAGAGYPTLQWPAYQVAQRMPVSPPGLSVFIGNLPPTLTNDELTKLIRTRLPHATLIALNVHRDRRFGFATFESAQAATDACQVLDGLDVHERKIRAEITQNEPKQQPGGGGRMPRHQPGPLPSEPRAAPTYANSNYAQMPPGVAYPPPQFAVPTTFAYDPHSSGYRDNAQAISAWSR